MLLCSRRRRPLTVREPRSTRSSAHSKIRHRQIRNGEPAVTSSLGSCRNQLLDAVGDRTRFLVSPYPYDLPTGIAKSPRRVPVTLLVRLDLISPPSHVRLRP